MPIPNANIPAVILLCEIDLQCKFIFRAASWLRDAADHWQKLTAGIDDGATYPPIEIVARCNIILSAAAAVSRMLFVVHRKGAKSMRISRRCEVLMALLGQPSLNAVRSLAVRNSWEHLDERLDDVLAVRAFTAHSEVHVSPKPPSVDTFVNRRFDPITFSICHGPDVVELNPLVQECEVLVDRVNQAFKTLGSQLHDPYAPPHSAA
jgi:hypothetical protein